MNDADKQNESSAGYVEVPEGVLCQHVADEMVLLHLESGVYYGLEPIGTRMLDLACEMSSSEEVVAQLHQEFEATPDVLEHDLDFLLGQLLEKGLITSRDNPANIEAEADEEPTA